MFFYFIAFVISEDIIVPDGEIIFCNQDTSGLLSPFDPIPPSGTIIFCNQNTSELLTP